MRKMDFLRAIDRTPVDVSLGDQVYQARKADLVTFFRLQDVLQAYQSTQDQDYKMHLMLEYVRLAVGASHQDAERWYFGDVMDAFPALLAQNEAMVIHLDFAKSAGGHIHEYEYDHRSLASIVIRLAMATGWSRDDILHLTYDEAKCYLQEVALVQYYEREFAYNISQVGFDQKGNRVPFQPPSFPSSFPGTAVVRPTRYRDSRLSPVGVVKRAETRSVDPEQQGQEQEIS